MDTRDTIVVGAGLAGLRTVEALRRHGSAASITLLGDELALPYDRPPLSKDVLTGKNGRSDTALTTAEALKALDIEVRLGVRAEALDVEGHLLTTSDGTISYGRIVLATGSSARHLPHLGGLEGVHMLRTAQDAARIRRALLTGPRVVVIGGGFIGAEVASSARSLGLDTTIIDPLRVLMHRGLGAVIGERASALHRNSGVHLLLSTQVESLIGGHRVEGVCCNDGTVVPADLVVVGVGATPNTEWLRGSSLNLDDGVVCDEVLRAAPDVYAVGDLARWFHPLYGETFRAEHWTSAVEHADAVAATLTGKPTPCVAVPLVWSDQHGVKFQVAGRVLPDDEITWVIDQPGKFLAVTGSVGRQHAAVAMSAPAAIIRERRKLGDRAPWPPVTGPIR